MEAEGDEWAEEDAGSITEEPLKSLEVSEDLLPVSDDEHSDGDDDDEDDDWSEERD